MKKTVDPWEPTIVPLTQDLSERSKLLQLNKLPSEWRAQRSVRISTREPTAELRIHVSEHREVKNSVQSFTHL